ncbi:hypothetical protein KUV57_12565 [Epibacterium sp. DP7N7-1]|nr:hypothetical protein [Epibacterium sp. DP7N7-1]
MMTEGDDIVALHTSDVALDDDEKFNDRGAAMFGACILVAVGVAVMELITHFAGHTVLSYLLKTLVIMIAGFFISLNGITIWKDRGEKAKKRMSCHVSNGVELFLPEALESLSGTDE